MPVRTQMLIINSQRHFVGVTLFSVCFLVLLRSANLTESVINYYNLLACILCKTASNGICKSFLMNSDSRVLCLFLGWFGFGASRKGLLKLLPLSLMASAVPSLLKEVSLLLGKIRHMFRDPPIQIL